MVVQRGKIMHQTLLVERPYLHGLPHGAANMARFFLGCAALAVLAVLIIYAVRQVKHPGLFKAPITFDSAAYRWAGFHRIPADF